MSLQRPLLVVASLSALLCTATAYAEDTPRQTAVREEVTSRLVQVDISVLKPGSKSYASVPGLTLDHFEIRLNDRSLSMEERQKIIFEPICDSIQDEGASSSEEFSQGVGDEKQPVLVIVDLNYIDSRGRHLVADVLDQLAERATGSRAMYKIYGITAQVLQLNHAFTSDPAEIRRAAKLIRNSAERGPMTRSATSSIKNAKPGYETNARRLDHEGIPFDDNVAFLDLFIGTPVEIPEAVRLILDGEIKFSDFWGDALSDYRPAASLASLEGIMRAHAHLKGRKAVLLFTSEAFRFSEQSRLFKEAENLQKLYGKGFTIWPIDVEGIGRKNSRASELITMLAQDSGGDSIRNTNQLMRAFEGAEEQLSCYYLLSLPVSSRKNKTIQYDLMVKLNTTKYKELWGYRVIAPSRITIPDEQTKLRDQRVSALFSPDDYDHPHVDAVIDYPILRGSNANLPVRIRTPLKDLTWISTGNGVRARVLVDAVVELNTSRGTKMVCKSNTNDLGVLELSLPRPPDPSSNAGLSIELPCLMKPDGLYTARGVITDLESGKSGAGRISVRIHRKGLNSWTVLAPRIQATSGKDFVWTSQMKSAVRDKKRKAWRLVTSARPASVEDRLAARYVLCGPDRPGAKEAIQHVLLHVDVQGKKQVKAVIPAEGLKLAPTSGEGAFCSPAMVTIPEFSLEPGNYALALLRRGSETESALAALTDSSESLPEGVFSLLPFEVLP